MARIQANGASRAPARLLRLGHPPRPAQASGPPQSRHPRIPRPLMSLPLEDRLVQASTTRSWGSSSLPTPWLYASCHIPKDSSTYQVSSTSAQHSTSPSIQPYHVLRRLAREAVALVRAEISLAYMGHRQGSCEACSPHGAWFPALLCLLYTPVIMPSH